MHSIAILATILANRSLSLHIHPLTDAQNQLNADHHTDLESQRHKRRRAWSPWDNWSENDKGILSQAVTHMKTKMHYDVGKARHGETSQPMCGGCSAMMTFHETSTSIFHRQLPTTIKFQWRITSATYCKYSMLSSDWGEQQQQQEETNKKHGNNSNCDFSNAQFRMPLRTNILAQANCFGQGYGESSLSTLSPGCGWQERSLAFTGHLRAQNFCPYNPYTCTWYIEWISEEEKESL